MRSDAPGPSSAAEGADPEGTAVAAIRESCLVPFLERQLVGASFTDMASRCGWRWNRVSGSWLCSKKCGAVGLS